MKKKILKDPLPKRFKKPPSTGYVKKIRSFFDLLYPDPRCGLNFEGPFQLLVATILSAQCTDAMVNKVTPALFDRFPDIKSMAEGSLVELEGLVKSCGFFHNKALHIIAASQQLLEEFGGEVPPRLEDLVRLPGVGRKTANVVLGNAFDIPGLTVDTHLGRISRRLGLSSAEEPEKVERDLMEIIPRRDWTRFSHQAIAHGRSICRSARPLCRECPIDICPSSCEEKL